MAAEITDVERLAGILAQFDRDVVRRAAVSMGFPITAERNPETVEGPGRRVTPEVIIGSSILEAAQILSQSGRYGIQIPVAEGIPVALAITTKTGITLKCPGQVTLYARENGEVKKYDGPGGDTAAQVKAAAITAADTAAKKAVTDELNRQIALVNCPSGCAKQIGTLNVRLTVPGTITSQDTGNSVWDSYTATSTADGDVTVSCT